MPKSLPCGRARLCLSVAAGLLASPLVLAAAPDPFAPFPVADGEASDPRIEALRAELRPEAFKPTHDVVITDELFFKYKGFRKFTKGCGGDPSALTMLPPADARATPFRMTFANAAAPIRGYVGTGYGCTFPTKIGPLALGPDLAKVHGLITYSDGSYWLGEVTGASHPESLESILYAFATPLTPTPGGLGEWGRADGTRLQGIARAVRVAKWTNKSWTSPTTIIGFEMTSVQRTMLPDGARLAGGEGPAPAATPVLPDAAVRALQAAIDSGAIPAPSGPPASSPAPTAAPVASPAAPGVAAAAPTDPQVAALAARIDGWRTVMQSDNFASARSSIASVGLSKARDYNSHVQACGGGGPTPFRLGFANADAQIRSYTGFATGCTFPAQPSEQVSGLIEYADGSRWLGQVAASPQAEAIQLGAFGGLPAPVHNLVPAPHGAGEWTWPDGTRVQGLAAPLQPKFLFRDSWTQGPLGAFAMTEVAQLVTTDGVAYTGGITLSERSFSAEQATARWPDGRVFTGSVANSMPRSGTLAYPDGGRIKGTVVLGEDSITRWDDGAELDLSIETKAGPPGRYRYFAPIRFDTVEQALLEVADARPMDAATLARAGRNTRQCPQPPVIPADWVVWWPACSASRFGRVPMYSPDAQQALLYYPDGVPNRYLLRKPAEPGAVGGFEIRADAFTRDATPSPVGQAELYVWQELVFKGNFVGQEPSTGNCAVPADEGGGWEACEYSLGARIDPAHQLRQERRELARQQEELRRQIEQEQYAQEDWEAEQEQAELREQIRQDEIAGRMAIANAIRGAAYDIGMAYAEREAARDAADYRDRQAAREAARPSYSPAPSSGGYGGSSGQGNEERASQLAARQAELERRQAELRQRQALATAPRPAPAMASPSGGATSASSGASAGGGTESYGFTIADHNVGRVSATRQILGLAVTLEIKRVGLRISAADRSEICANFENRTAANWSGGYRLTDRDARDTHASMSVPAGGTARKCETLNPQTGYTVVLRQNRS